MPTPKRGKLNRPSRPRRYRKHILIVTEGKKTEPNYFNDLVRIERITGSKIEVLHSEFGTDPLSVVDYAVHLKKINLSANKKYGEPKFDKVYCVVDRDDHDKVRYTQACDKGAGNGITIIRSIPCFEIWYLLHKEYTTRTYDDREKLIKDLKKYLGSYEKSDRLYSGLRSEQALAIERAKQLYTEQSKCCDVYTDHPNPLTEVHRLVIDIKDQKEM